VQWRVLDHFDLTYILIYVTYTTNLVCVKIMNQIDTRNTRKVVIDPHNQSDSQCYILVQLETVVGVRGGLETTGDTIHCVCAWRQRSSETHPSNFNLDSPNILRIRLFTHLASSSLSTSSLRTSYTSPDSDGREMLLLPRIVCTQGQQEGHT